MVVPNHDLHNICTLIAKRCEGRRLDALVRLHVLIKNYCHMTLQFSLFVTKYSQLSLRDCSMYEEILKRIIELQKQQCNQSWLHEILKKEFHDAEVALVVLHEQNRIHYHPLRDGRSIIKPL